MLTTRLAAAAAAVALAAAAAPAQHCATARVVVAAPVYAAPVAVQYAAPYAAPVYYAPVVRRTVIVQQDYVVEPQVTEVVEILDARQAKAQGFGYYGSYDYYPNKVAVIREVVQRKTIVVAPPADAAPPSAP